ncbi:hypothetical protein GCM10023238_36400 [Streptomyces heliomycini]
MNRLSKVFELDPAGLDWPRAVMVLDVALVPLVVFWEIGHRQYLLSALFGLLFAALDDREAATAAARRTSPSSH